MAGPLTIQRYPAGMPDILGMQVSGTSPQTLGNTVQATVAVEDFYTANRYVVVSGSTPVVPTGFGNFICTGTTVPSGEMWLMYQFTVTVPQLLAGSTLNGGAGLFRAAGVPWFFQLTPTLSLAATQGGSAGNTFPRPIIMTAGDALGWHNNYHAAGPGVNPTVYALVAKLSV